MYERVAALFIFHSLKAAGKIHPVCHFVFSRAAASVSCSK
jgi:hypothetical protein